MLNHLSIGEKLHSILREGILSGKYKPGERLLFDKIAEEHGVSMTPIKEAFLLLEKENLAVTIPRRGTFVEKFSEQDIMEYYQIRLAMEELAGDLICKKGLTPTFEKELLSACEEQETHTKNKDPKKCVAADIHFHSILVKASQNSKLYSLIKTLPITNLYNFTNETEKYFENSSIYVSEHREIVKLLIQKDLIGVKAILKSHIAIMLTEYPEGNGFALRKKILARQ